MKRPPVLPPDRPHVDRLYPDDWVCRPLSPDARLMRHGIEALLQTCPIVAPSALGLVFTLAEYEQTWHPALSPLDGLACRIEKKQWPYPADRDFVILEAIDLVRELPNKLAIFRIVLRQHRSTRAERPLGISGEVQR